MQPFALENVSNLRLGTKFDYQKNPQTTVSFTTNSDARQIANLIDLYRKQPINITIQSPQMHLFNPAEEK